MEDDDPGANARDSFIANISGCGVCADSRRLQSAQSIYLACWYASRARGWWNMGTRLTPSEKATYSSCLPRLGGVSSGRAVQ